MRFTLPSLALLASNALAVDPLVTLPHASYRGVPLSNGITQWLGMSYAAPPVGDLRFAAPADVNIENKEYLANKQRPACIGVDTNPNDKGFSEDCLHLNVYAPSNAAADANLPVFFYVLEGGFSGSSKPQNGSKLIETSGNKMVVVTFTYRVGPYGFLGGVVSKPNMSPKSTPDFSVNNGLKDQLKALQWVQQNIAAFGGNPKHVILGGASAGAGAAMVHLVNPNLQGQFAAAALESPAWPPLHTAQEAQFQFDNILKVTGCTDQFDQLACLRGLDVAAFQQKTKSKLVALPGSGASGDPVYLYAPILDGDVVHEYTYSAFFANHQMDIPMIVGDDTNEGTVFVPGRAAASLAAADAFVQDQFPQLNASALELLHAHPHYAPLIQENAFQGFAARLYGDMRYVCPNLFVAWTAPVRARNANIWTYRFDIQGATHIMESAAVWGGWTGRNETLKALQNSVHAYWASFIATSDPNVAKDPAAPTWEPSGKTDGWQANRLLFTDKTGPQPQQKMELVDEQQWDACVMLMNLGVELKQ